jgi:ribosomal protein L29
MKKDQKEIKTITEVEKNLVELREKLRGIRFGTTGSKAKNVKEQKNLRREVARMETMKTALNK